MFFVLLTSRFKAKHSGVSDPSLFLSFRGVGGVKVTFVSGFHMLEVMYNDLENV